MKNSITIRNNIINYSIAQKGDDFVGLKIQQNHFDISFPMGYNISSCVNSKDLIFNIKVLIATLNDFGSKNEGILDSSIINENQKAEFPINACLFLITDFLQHGYYSERQKVYYQDNKGKINWAKTIKKINPLLTENKDIIYLDFIVQKSLTLEDELITQIHKYCVWKAFSFLGFLYTSYIPQKPNIPFNKNLFIQTLKKYLGKSFSQKNNYLFYNMIAFLENWNESASSKILVGTNSFEHIWEYMVDCVYGTYEKYSKESFYPFSEWHIHDKETNNHLTGKDSSFLRPDTILLSKGNVYILDSKYYRYKGTNISTLPPTESTAKQIIYGEYVDTNRDNFGLTEESKIFNIFILPYKLSKKDFKPQYFGYSDAAWKKTEEKSYFKIISILLDTTNLMENYLQPGSIAKKQLTECIETAFLLKE